MIIDSHAYYNNNCYKKPFWYLTWNADGYAFLEGDRGQLFKELLETNITYSIKPAVSLQSCEEMLKHYQNTFGTFVGPAKILISSDTMQVKDYSCYNWTMFSLEAKKKRRETVFPENKQKAFSMGVQMVNNPC